MRKLNLTQPRNARWRWLLALFILVLGAGLTNPAPSRAEGDDVGDLYLPLVTRLGPRTTTQIVFYSNYEGNDEIYRMDQNGANLTRLTTTASSVLDQSPAWNPSQSQIVFVSNRDGQNEIYTMNIDGSNVQRLTNNSCDDIAPAWSRITGRIAWASNCDSIDYEIWTMTATGLDQLQITNNDTSDSRPKWSTITNEIVYVAGNNIAIMNGDGTNSHTLVAGSDPDWSPNGLQIVYTCGTGLNREICLIDVAGGPVTPLSDLPPPSIQFRPAWGPTGQELVLLSNKDDVNYDVFTMTVAISNTQLFRVPSTIDLPAGFSEGSPDWY